MLVHKSLLYFHSKIKHVLNRTLTVRFEDRMNLSLFYVTISTCNCREWAYVSGDVAVTMSTTYVGPDNMGY